jgi:ABC-type phosphate transport system substrate-binding protein
MHYRKNYLRNTLAGLCCLVALVRPALAVQPQLAIIIAPKGPQLTLDRNTLRNVYLKKIFVDQEGRKLNPVNLPTSSPLRDAFVRSIIQMPDTQLQDYWEREYFQGVSPPYVLGSQDAVVRFVAVTPGAIGYVALCHVDATVHVALLITLPPRAVDDISGCQDRAAP